MCIFKKKPKQIYAVEYTIQHKVYKYCYVFTNYFRNEREVKEFVYKTLPDRYKDHEKYNYTRALLKKGFSVLKLKVYKDLHF